MSNVWLLTLGCSATAAWTKTRLPSQNITPHKKLLLTLVFLSMLQHFSRHSNIRAENCISFLLLSCFSNHYPTFWLRVKRWAPSTHPRILVIIVELKQVFKFKNFGLSVCKHTITEQIVSMGYKDSLCAFLLTSASKQYKNIIFSGLKYVAEEKY